jgi:serine/threonine protein kinase/Tfp pilus assembly protein PilF
MAEQVSEQSIFLRAVGLASPGERAAYLDDVCRGKPALRLELDPLLAAHDRLGADPVPIGPEPPRMIDEPITERPGTLIGPYKLIEEIGEGGMGTVYMAQQTEPVKRLVALKLIKPGMDSRQVLARFNTERQALALMEHANIARVLDAGATGTGRPYFVMELVKGMPLTKYCDEHRLTPKDRLELFIPVCQAIQHAHQKGIIHRDIKPSNVLVALYDGKPVAKVIDFGVAKAAGQQLTEQTLVTGFGAVVGTLEYMSPEQAELNQLDVDTRSDIYSLGVLLYELLTGTTPLDRKRLKEAAMLEVLRIIREEEPPRPSTRLSSTEEMPSIAANRGLEPRKLTGLVRGELDWIVMKALEKDRNRRYETASALAADVERYLADEPVLACPPSALYRLRKFVRRNKGPVLTVAIVLAVLVGGIVGTAWGLVQARRSAAAEKAANELTQKRLAQIEKGNEILSGIFAELDMVEVKRSAQPVEVALAERLVKAADDLAGESVGDPLVVAALQERLGVSLIHLGFGDRAIPALERSRQTRQERLGPDHADTLSCMTQLAHGYSRAGKLELALPLFEESFKRAKAKFGPDRFETVFSMSGLASGYLAAGKADQALPLLEDAVKLCKTKQGADHPYTLGEMTKLAIAYEVVGKLDLALALKEETFKLHKARLGSDHPTTLAIMNTLAEGYRIASKLDLALPLAEENLKLTRTKLGHDNPQTLLAMSTLARCYLTAGKVDLAVPLAEETHQRMKSELGPDNPITLTCLRTLASGYLNAGKLDQALPLFETTLALSKSKLGPDHPDTLGSMQQLAYAYVDVGKLELALPLFEESFKRAKAKYGRDRPETIVSMSGLAKGYFVAGKADLALPLVEEAVKLRKAKQGVDHPDTLSEMNNLAIAYERTGKLDLALALFEKTLALRKTKLGPDHPQTLNTMASLGPCYWSLRQLNKSIPLFEDLLKRRESKLGRQHPDTLLTVADLGANYTDAGRPDPAFPLLEEAYGASKKYPTLAWAGAKLVEAYLLAGKKTEAETLFRQLLADARRTVQPASPQLADKLAELGFSLLAGREFAGAEPILREALTIRQKKQPDHWATFMTQAHLGEALLGQKKYADAEPPLLAGYAGMKKREKTIPPQGQLRLPKAANRLVELYTLTNQPDELKKWQLERTKYPQTEWPAPRSNK